MEAGDLPGYQGSSQVVDQGTEAGIFLGWTSDNGEGPDGIPAMVDGLHLEDREVVLQAVVAQMITEGSLGPGGLRVHRTDDAEVRVG